MYADVGKLFSIAGKPWARLCLKKETDLFALTENLVITAERERSCPLVETLPRGRDAAVPLETMQCCDWIPNVRPGFAMG